MRIRVEVTISATILLGAFLSSFNQWLLATQFSKEEYGVFASSWSITQLALQFLVFGTHHFLLNRGIASFKLWFRHVLIMTVINAMLFLLSFLFYHHFFNIGSSFSFIVVLLLWSIFSIPVTLIYTHFQLIKDVRLVGVWPLLQVVLRSLVILISVLLGLSLLDIAMGYVICAIALSATAVGLIWRKRLLGRSFKISPRKTGTIYRKSGPYFIFEFMEKIDLKVSVPISFWMLGPEKGAEMSIVVGMLLAMLVVPQGLVQRYYLADIHRWSRSSLGDLDNFIKRTSLILFILSILAILFLSPFIQPLVSFIFMGKYDSISEPVLIMMLVVPFLLVTNVANNRFLSLKNIKALQFFQIGFFALFLILFFTLTGCFGLIGACYAILVYRASYLIGLFALKYVQGQN